MKFLKSNKKLFIGLLIGLLLSGITVYATNEILFASSQISFDNTRAGLIKANGDDVETLEDAIEALARVGSCPVGYEMANLGDHSLTCRNTTAPICRRAQAGTLHTETCNQGTNGDSYYCYYDGYYVGGTKNTTTITYGKLGTTGVKPSVGDAFDCDINKDGQFDPVTERFYYVSDYFDTNAGDFDNTTATLIYYKNFVGGAPNDGGVAYFGTNSAYNNWHRPTTAVAALPVAAETPTGNEWRNDLLKTDNRKIQACSDHNCTSLSDATDGGPIVQTEHLYQGKAARLIHLKEIKAGCTTDLSQIKSLSGDCNFLMERAYYANPSGYPTYGPWPENPRSDSATVAWSVVGSNRMVVNNNTYRTIFGARPAIDVLYSDISY